MQKLSSPLGLAPILSARRIRSFTHYRLVFWSNATELLDTACSDSGGTLLPCQREPAGRRGIDGA